MKKYTLLLIVFVGLSSTILAQDSPKHEIGIRLSDLRDFNVIYKKKTDENTYFRLRSSFARITTGNNVTSIGFGAYVGPEKRKAIGDRSQFIYGGELGVFGSYGSFNNTQSSSFNFSLGVIIGIQHELSDYFNLGLELVPTLNINTATNIEPSFTFDASFSTAAIFVTYKFGKTSG